MKVALLFMAVLTVIYVGAACYVYASLTSVAADDYLYVDPNNYPDVGYVAYEWKPETPPTKWYTPEELGIVLIYDIGEDGDVFEIGAIREKEPFQLFGVTFKYEDKFYTVSEHWITLAGCEPNVKATVMLVSGAGLGLGWLFTGVLFFKGRKKQ